MCPTHLPAASLPCRAMVLRARHCLRVSPSALPPAYPPTRTLRAESSMHNIPRWQLHPRRLDSSIPHSRQLQTCRQIGQSNGSTCLDRTRRRCKGAVAPAPAQHLRHPTHQSLPLARRTRWASLETRALPPPGALTRRPPPASPSPTPCTPSPPATLSTATRPSYHFHDVPERLLAHLREQPGLPVLAELPAVILTAIHPMHDTDTRDTFRRRQH